MKKGLTGNQIKLLGALFMTVDHLGLALFPQVVYLRIIGRLAFPLFAYMIAEGCSYTRNMGRYLATMTALAVGCQAVYFFAMGSLYQSVLVTFSLSIGLICLVKTAISRQKWGWWLLVAVGLAAVFFLAEVLPSFLKGTDFGIDYGFWGILLPVMVFLSPGKEKKLMSFSLCLVLLAFAIGQIQWASLLALPLLAAYNGQRGRWKMKYFFYIYYPAHLVAIYTIGLLG